MDNKHFNEIVHGRQAKTKGILADKGLEYSPGLDRLSNFKTAARMLHCTPERALLGFLTKHLISIVEAINELETHQAMGETFGYRFWDEKIGDSINYLILLEGLIIERIEAAEAAKAVEV